MRTRDKTRRAGQLVLVLTFLAAGCGSDTNLIGPDNQLEVANATDSFQWQVSALGGITQTLSYTWANTGSTANVDQASSLTGGAASVRVLDASGTEVYLGDLGSNGTFVTSAGMSGDWTVTVTLADAEGTLNFRLQRP